MSLTLSLECTCGPEHTPGSTAVYREQVIVDGLIGSTRPHPIDRCIAFEIIWLNERGIETLGSCCGHNISPPLISTAPSQRERMEALGYVEDEYHVDDASGRWWIGWLTKTLTQTGSS